MGHRTSTLSRPANEARFSLRREGGVVKLAGELRIQDGGRIWRDLHRATEDVASGATLAIDLGAVEAIDGGVIALLGGLRSDLAARGVRSRVASAGERIRPLVELYDLEAAPPRPQKRRPESTIEQIGTGAASVLAQLRAAITFVGEIVVAIGGLVRHPRSGHWKEIPALVNRAGADAIPIVALLTFLLGFVTAYQAARQLKMYGANLYVADLVGISVTRELAPLMTAIIVCGRSGAAFAAEIGTMKVSEEVDALRTLGLRPFAWLVVPRVIALLLVVPALTVIADIVGVLGGLIVAVTSLDISARAYFVETQTAVLLWDVEHGLIKSFAYAIAIALIACQQGFAASGGAEGVGRRTTSTVVTCLFALVVIDAAFTLLFRFLGR